MGFQEWVKGFTYRSGFQNMDSILRSSFITELKHPVTVTKSSRGWNFIFYDKVVKDVIGRAIFRNEYTVNVYNEIGNYVGKMKWKAATLGGHIHSTVEAISPDSFPMKVGYRMDFSIYYNIDEMVERNYKENLNRIQNNETNINNLGRTSNDNDSLHADKLKQLGKQISTLSTQISTLSTTVENNKNTASDERIAMNTDLSSHIVTINKNIYDLSKQTSDLSNAYVLLDERIYNIENYGVENFTSTIQQGGYGTITGAQQRLINITEQEKDRLDNIHQNYRDQDDNRDKMQMLMLSEKDKQNKYMLLAVIFAFVFVVAFFLTYIQNVKKNKSVWFDIIMVLLIAAALIYALVVYIDIQNRDPNNFSKLAPDSDSLLVVQTRTGDGKHGVKYGIAATTDLQGGGCKGDACCGPGSYWDEVNGRCIQNVS